ncbi:MAG: TetR/AcrR family transcriptional regulator C-terminal domain-containing protein [Allobaculum sp.]|nr:TetR/AcrR family transcriptional regulator C-terminal domain-containing protein [Allobaculum sp.]
MIKKQFIQEYSKSTSHTLSVKNLCSEIPIARSTFYHYFDQIDEVKQEIENDLLNGLQTIVSQTFLSSPFPSELSPLFKKIKDYILVYYQEFYSFLIIQPNSQFIKNWKKFIKENCKTYYLSFHPTSYSDLISELMACGALEVYKYWLTSPDKMSDEEMVFFLTRELQKIRNSL